MAVEIPSKARVKAFVIQHWLPIVFTVAIIFSLAYPVPGKALLHVVVLGDVRIVQEICMGIVFFISGLTLNTQEVRKAKGHVTAVLYGFLANLVFTPCLGFVMRVIPLQPKLFTIGLVIFCVVPTTLGVGVALVRACKGNEGIALLMTVGTNLVGVFTMPLALKLLFLNYDLSGLSVRVNILNLFTKLIITILAPSVLGKALREFYKPACKAAGMYRTELSLTSTALLAFIVWQTLSGARDLLFESQGGMVVSVIVISGTVHIFFLLINYVIISLLLKMPTPEAIAVIITSSQKSAPVAVTVISYITSSSTEMGLLAIPSIVGQLAQIFIGAAFTPAVVKRAEAFEALQAKTVHGENEHPPTDAPSPAASVAVDADSEKQLDAAMFEMVSPAGNNVHDRNTSHHNAVELIVVQDSNNDGMQVHDTAVNRVHGAHGELTMDNKEDRSQHTVINSSTCLDHPQHIDNHNKTSSAISEARSGFNGLTIGSHVSGSTAKLSGSSQTGDEHVRAVSGIAAVSTGPCDLHQEAPDAPSDTVPAACSGSTRQGMLGDVRIVLQSDRTLK